MDMNEVMIVRKLVDADATNAAGQAIEAAELAQQYGYKFTVDNNTLVVGEEDEE